MRVLLDENLPHDLTKVLTGHVAFTVQGLGWSGTKNGALLKRASGECDVFVTLSSLTYFRLSVAYGRVKCAASAHLRRGGGD